MTIRKILNVPVRWMGAPILGLCIPMLSAETGNRDDPTTAENSRVEYLDNGVVRIGIDLSIGGAITYFADQERGINMVNSHDWGRQIQMSFYSYPRPFEPNGKKPLERWKGLGWNPIQSGDVFENRSQVIDFTNDGETLYVKCIPMHWPLDNQPGECTFETWIQLEGATAKVRSRLNNHRSDTAQYRARSQELPAVYTNGPWYRLITYQGPQPFSGDELTEIPIKDKKPGEFPWSRFQATENWAALVDEEGHGLGVWNYGSSKFLGGFHGKPGMGGPKDGPTGYIAPLHDDILDHNIQYEYSYQLIAGTIEEIRDYVYGNSSGPVKRFDFSSDRQHWTYENASDSGWPVRAGLQVKLDQDQPRLISPLGCWNADDYPAISITAAFKTDEQRAYLQWMPFDPEAESPKSIAFKIVPDGKLRTYTIELKGKPGYEGAIRQFILLPSKRGSAGHSMTLQKFELVPAND
ncbi:MAG: hypothetical protein O3C43_08670 [Verrucomicrobia bacterium]|nr:hypothetical protein [Verrucomicrobiota bacterium]MDA1066560.1 hypothetical protein [Verrucomicrobiota bacterium]